MLDGLLEAVAVEGFDKVFRGYLQMTHTHTRQTCQATCAKPKQVRIIMYQFIWTSRDVHVEF